MEKQLGEQRPMMNKFKMGMLLFIASESVFFLMLILAFCDFNGVRVPGPDARTELKPWETGIYTALLISSSFTIWMAERHAKKRNRNWMRFWLAGTIALGMAFLYGEATEWRGLIHKQMTISRNLFGSTFFTLTGFHGLHVCIGLIMLLVVFFATFSRKHRDPSPHALESVAIYWHFVDVVWIFVFSVVYIWGTRK